MRMRGQQRRLQQLLQESSLATGTHRLIAQCAGLQVCGFAANAIQLHRNIGCIRVLLKVYAALLSAASICVHMRLSHRMP
jgi:hypothetical protein